MSDIEKDNRVYFGFDPASKAGDYSTEILARYSHDGSLTILEIKQEKKMSDKYTIEVEKANGGYLVTTGELRGQGHTLWQALSVLCGKIREHEKEDPAQEKLPNV